MCTVTINLGQNFTDIGQIRMCVRVSSRIDMEYQASARPAWAPTPATEHIYLNPNVLHDRHVKCISALTAHVCVCTCRWCDSHASGRHPADATV